MLRRRLRLVPELAIRIRKAKRRQTWLLRPPSLSQSMDDRATRDPRCHLGLLFLEPLMVTVILVPVSVLDCRPHPMPSQPRGYGNPVLSV